MLIDPKKEEFLNEQQGIDSAGPSSLPNPNDVPPPTFEESVADRPVNPELANTDIFVPSGGEEPGDRDGGCRASTRTDSVAVHRQRLGALDVRYPPAGATQAEDVRLDGQRLRSSVRAIDERRASRGPQRLPGHPGVASCE